MIINVKELIGNKYAMSKEDGQLLYKTINDNIRNKVFIEIDLSNIERATTLFFNESICRIIVEYCKTDELSKVKFKIINDVVRTNFDKAINLTISKINNR